MRRLVVLTAALVSVLAWPTPEARPRAQAQRPKELAGPTAVQQALRKADSPALRDLPAAPPAADLGITREGRPYERVIRNRALPREDAADASPAPLVDGALQQAIVPSIAALTPPITSFEGMSNQDNANLFGFRVSPPDTDGDVGPNHYVQMTNLTLRVWDKKGTPLMPAAKSSSFWTALGGLCADEDLGDPIVLYDDLADRWLISQFNSEDTIVGPHHQCVAISKSGDPMDSWHLYDFVMPNQNFNDYPKFGVWRDAYYMTDNQFSPFAFAGVGAFAFDRSKMLVGDPTASYIYFDLPPATFIAGLLPADSDGIVAPKPDAPGLFSFFTADEFGDPEGDGLRLFEFRANFDTPAASSFSELPFVPVAPFDPRSPLARRDIEQPSPATATMYLDSISDRLMHRLQYRTIGDTESLVVTHTVNAGTGTTLDLHKAGIRYYVLQRVSGGPWTLAEQATYSPDNENRWMGSAALDGAGNLAVGYSVSSLTTFPSIRYAARLPFDPPGGLHQGEQTLIAGTGVQRSTFNRWGDYSAMAVDPTDDCTFWYTQEYYTAAGQIASTVGWQTRIGSFKVDPKCKASARGRVKISVVNCATGSLVDGALVEVSNGASRAVVDGKAEVVASPGRYTLRVTAPGYLPAQESVRVSDGEQARETICLKPIPVIRGVSAEVTREGCQPSNGAIDPDERVTVRLTLKNEGAGGTLHSLWAYLQPGGGVQNPSLPQFIGSLDPGESASRSFSFRAAGGCGTGITMTLRLFIGFFPFGSVEFPATLGERITSTVAAANPEAIQILDNQAAVPYPSAIEVSGATAPIDTVTVTLNGFSHTFPSDVAFVLQGPSGQSVTLMANRGSGFPVSDVTLTFDDDAARTVPEFMVSGTYRPSLGLGVPLPAPAPAAPASALAVFKGTNANGVWKLFGADQFNLDAGSLAGGWSITINSVEYRCATQCSIR